MASVDQNSHVVYPISLYLLLFIARFPLVSPCNLTCINGQCQNINGLEKCICTKGWQGTTCNQCGGRVRFNDTAGIITDGIGNYSTEMKCTWLIDSSTFSVGLIFLQVDSFATECGWDYLYVYDGNSAYAPMIAAFSGIESVETNNSKLSLMMQSGAAYLHFFSDAAYTMSGFTLRYSVVQCPYNCSGHGVCNLSAAGASVGKCVCDSDWSGEGCERLVCPSDCPQKSCAPCQPDCGTSEKGCWTEVWPNAPQSSVVPSMASHGSVLINDRLWVVSGYNFTMSSSLHITRFDLTQPNPTALPELSITSSVPLSRYGYSLVTYRDVLFVFGGVTTKGVSNELWQFNITSNAWSLVANSNASVPPYAVAGHTAHVINGTMFVIFGHSPLYGFFSIVQLYDIESNHWSVASTSGAFVFGSYGHSSVYDVNSRLIYVHGGCYSTNYSSALLSDSLYSFNPVTKIWTVLASSGYQRFLHSAVILNGLMMIFGGNTHNDTAYSQGAKCQSNELLAYDIACKRWYYLDGANFGVDVARYGHSANVYGNEIYIYAGFNGMFMNDFLIYTPASCAMYNNKSQCLSSRQGIQCVWADDKQCLSPGEALKMQSYKYIEKYSSPTCSDPSVDEKNSICAAQQFCSNCLQTTVGCVWCGDSCKQTCDSNSVSNPAECANASKPGSDCDLRHNCVACERNGLCVWNKRDNICQLPDNTVKLSNSSQCDLPCSARTTCENCTSAACMWCSNQQRCIESNSYIVSFPYGQCTEWTTVKSKCPGTRCSDIRTCADCQSQPYCGWCDDGSDRGLGTCMAGAASGPVVNDSAYTAANSTCPVHRWFFTDCPLCQCNGHSACYKGTSDCIQCEDNTIGSQCQYCQDSYWGNPTNGAKCSACSCNNNAINCDRSTGKCFCMTKGVTGDTCNSCDTGHKYYGDPISGTCFYQLTADFQFTFNLSKDDDKYISAINFMNTPLLADKDVDFAINCSFPAYINITVNSSGSETFVDFFPCRDYKYKFSHNDFDFGPKYNTSVLVYVYGFKTPFVITVAFSQFPQIDLLHFFITFFSCFLSLLLVAAILWKVKHRFDLRRRRQQQMLELQKMAKRPFTLAYIELDNNASLREISSVATIDKVHVALASDSGVGIVPSVQPSLSRCAVAIQPTSDNKAAVISAFIRLPTGSNSNYPPAGSTGLAIASTLVMTGNQGRTAGDNSLLNKGPDSCKRSRKCRWRHNDVRTIAA